MRPVVLAFALSFPFVATAQTASANRRWFADGAAGLSVQGSGAPALGASWAASLGRSVSSRVALRVTADVSPSRSVTECYDNPNPPQVICTTNLRQSIASFAIGVDIAPRADRGLYGSARLGAYMLGTRSGYWPGAYVGAGFAVPAVFGAVFVEAGAHAFAGAPQGQPSLVLPVRLGLRWRA